MVSTYFMKTAVSIFILCLLTGFRVQAGADRDSVRTLSDSLSHKVGGKVPKKDKVCSCEILLLDLGNEQTQIIGVFAEKTAGDAGYDARVLSYYLQREKRQINHYLSFKVLQSNKSLQPGDCRTTYRSLKISQKRLHLYSILDLDVLGKLHVRKFVF